jgi:hypothetical protein
MTATAQQVKDITGSELADEAIEPFLFAAQCFMERISEETTSMTEVCLDVATAYLAAHLFTSSTVGVASRTIAEESLRGKYSVKYLTPMGQGRGILGSVYGETANAMTGGALAQLDKDPVNMFSIGSI